MNSWNVERQFGFISCDSSRGDVFLHAEGFRDVDVSLATFGHGDVCSSPVLSGLLGDKNDRKENKHVEAQFVGSAFSHPESWTPHTCMA